MRAIWHGKTIAQASEEDIIYIEGNWYFPPSSVKKEFLRESPTPYTCFWKGPCQYFDVGESDTWSKDNAWTYKELKPSAVYMIKKDFSNYVAFWQDVEVKA